MNSIMPSAVCSHYSTIGVAESRRFEYWNDVVLRHFARHKKTPMAVIWQERLRASREALERGRVSSVSQAALDFGFSDFSHFSHAFRKAFGISPRSLLPKEQQGATPSNRHTGSDS